MGFGIKNRKCFSSSSGTNTLPSPSSRIDIPKERPYIRAVTVRCLRPAACLLSDEWNSTRVSGFPSPATWPMNSEVFFSHTPHLHSTVQNDGIKLARFYLQDIQYESEPNVGQKLLWGRVKTCPYSRPHHRRQVRQSKTMCCA
jgi:hypothetical protein